jgi:predicted nuclease with RNAse H fold
VVLCLYRFCCLNDFQDVMILGIDLAGKENNPTGLCLLESAKAKLKIVYSDEEILEEIKQNSPELIAIDAPLSFGNRLCDKQLKYLGVMPLNLPSINLLAKRAVNLVNKIGKKEIIEVFPTGTAKILKVYSKNIVEYRNNLQSLINSTLPAKLNKHLIDAFLSALTGFLYLNQLTLSVGENPSYITIPNALNYIEIVEFIKRINFTIELA